MCPIGGLIPGWCMGAIPGLIILPGIGPVMGGIPGLYIGWAENCPGMDWGGAESDGWGLVPLYWERSARISSYCIERDEQLNKNQMIINLLNAHTNVQ